MEKLYQLILVWVIIRYFTVSFTRKEKKAESPITENVYVNGTAGRFGNPKDAITVATAKLRIAD
jgi:hypothetical protein